MNQIDHIYMYPFKVCQVAKAALGDQAQDSCAMAALRFRNDFFIKLCYGTPKKISVFFDLAYCRLLGINFIKSSSGATGLCWCLFVYLGLLEYHIRTKCFCFGISLDSYDANEVATRDMKPHGSMRTTWPSSNVT